MWRDKGHPRAADIALWRVHYSSLVAHYPLRSCPQEVSQRRLDGYSTGRSGQVFRELCDGVCGGDAILAAHLWTASSLTDGFACALHLDDKDAGHLPNLVVSLGLNRQNEVVLLRACLLMVVALYAETNLADKVLPGGFAQAHDQYGNIVLLEPPTAQLDLPEGLSPQEVPERESSVRLAMREGRVVILFFKSGGAIAAQLAHSWHAVVSTPPPPPHNPPQSK